MLKTVYYLTHNNTGERVRYYSTLQGARIAQRSRNRSLGFLTRIERCDVGDNCEVERCQVGDHIVDATYCIVEGTVESEELVYDDQ